MRLLQLLLQLQWLRLVVTELETIRAAPRSQRFQTSRKLLELRQRRLRRDLQKTRSWRIRTPDLPPMRRKLARDISHLFFGREDLDVDDRLQNYRPRLGKRV